MIAKILVVDDDITLSNALEDVLELDGYDVVSASDGNIGIKIAMNNPLDLIICDYQMPEMNGGEFINVLHQDKRTAHIPVILATGFDASQMVDIPSYVSMIMKPFDIGVLLATVEEVLAKASA